LPANVQSELRASAGAADEKRGPSPRGHVRGELRRRRRR
jgi:hypothetical protein